MSDGNDGLAVKVNNNLQSSLKYYNFEGLTKEQIIDKYEETLVQREKQIRDIAFEIGIINEKLCNSNEKVKQLEEENESLNNKLLKRNTLLEQELTNKDIMFIKLNNLQNDNDRLMQVLRDNGISLKSQSKDGKKSFFSGLMDKFSNKKDDAKNKESKSIQLNTKKEEKSPIRNTSSNNNLANSISASITPDLLNSIDLTNLTIKKEENVSSSQTTSSSNNVVNKPKTSNKNPLNRVSMPSQMEKRLATEGIDYEPVFK